MATSGRGWENERLPVVPVLDGGEKLPSNLKLAVEAWPEEEEQEEQEDSGEFLRAKPAFSGRS